jgi:hypothetical protein
MQRLIGCRMPGVVEGERSRGPVTGMLRRGIGIVQVVCVVASAPAYAQSLAQRPPPTFVQGLFSLDASLAIEADHDSNLQEQDGSALFGRLMPCLLTQPKSAGAYLLGARSGLDLVASYRVQPENRDENKPGGISYQPKLAIELGSGFTEQASCSKIDVICASDPAHKTMRVELSAPGFPGDITVNRSFF